MCIFLLLLDILFPTFDGMGDDDDGDDFCLFSGAAAKEGDVSALGLDWASISICN